MIVKIPKCWKLKMVRKKMNNNNNRLIIYLYIIKFTFEVFIILKNKFIKNLFKQLNYLN